MAEVATAAGRTWSPRPGAAPAPDPEGPGATRRNRLALAALASAALWSALLSLVTLNKLKDAVIGAVLGGQPLGAGLLLRTLGIGDVLLLLLAAGSAAALVVLEVRSRALSGFLATATPRQAAVALTIVAAWTGHAYLSPGVLLAGDTGTHIARFLEVARGLQDGTLPGWTNYQYLGAPLLWFTGPLTYVVGGVVTVLCGDAVVAAKAVLFVSHVASGLAFFAFLRRLDFRPVPALVGAAGFAGCFAHLHLFLHRGVFPQALTILFLVLLFHAAEGVVRGRGRLWANWLLFALSTAALVTNHQPHALFAAAYLGLYGLVSLLLGQWRWSRLPLLALAGALGGAMSAVAILHVLTESDWVMIEPGGALFRVRLPTPQRLAQLVLWRNFRSAEGSDYWAYLGITLVALAGVGTWAALRRGTSLPSGGHGAVLAALACFACGLFLYNPVVRDVLFLFFFLGIPVAAGVEQLQAMDRWRGRLALAVAGLVLLDLAGTSVQPVARTDKGYMAEAGRILERKAPDERYVQMNIGQDGRPTGDIGPVGGPVSYYATVQRVAGNHNMAATRVHNYAETTVKMAEADLRRDGRLAPLTRKLLGLWNVTRIVCFSSVAVGCPEGFADGTVEEGLGRVIRINASPVVFGGRLMGLEPPAGLDKPMFWPDTFEAREPDRRIRSVEDFLGRYVGAMGDAMGYDGASRAAAIPARNLPDAPALAAPQEWTPTVTSYQVGLERVRLEVRSNGRGYAQLAHPWFPASTVLVDGQPTTPWQGSTNLIVVPIHDGANVIEVLPSGTPARSTSKAVSLVGLLLALVGAAVLWARDRNPAAERRAAP